MNASRSITAVIGLVLLASGCAASPEEQPTITLEEAEQRVEGYFRAALAALPGEARPEPALIESYDCADPADEDTKGRKIASVDYEIHGLTRRTYSWYVNKLDSWWLNNNFYILIDERPGYQSIKVEKIDDGFQMRVLADKESGFVLIATSPCVWPDGTP